MKEKRGYLLRREVLNEDLGPIVLAPNIEDYLAKVEESIQGRSDWLEEEMRDRLRRLRLWLKRGWTHDGAAEAFGLGWLFAHAQIEKRFSAGGRAGGRQRLVPPDDELLRLKDRDVPSAAFNAGVKVSSVKKARRQAGKKRV